MNLDSVRADFAKEMRRALDLRCDALTLAFARVARERFLGPGPWWVAQSGYRLTLDDNPVHLYANVRVAVDVERELNNGRPYTHARWIDELSPTAGEHVVHIGAGTGYYSAILASMIGARGRLTAIECDTELATRLRSNLAAYSHVVAIDASGIEFNFGRADAIYVNAGLTHPPAPWLDRLALAGRMILPLTEMGPERFGAVLWIRRLRSGFEARFLDAKPDLRIYPCQDGRSPIEEARLAQAFGRGGHMDVRSLRRDTHAPDASCWLHSDTWCLSIHEPGNHFD